MIYLYRIENKDFKDQLDGYGAQLYGGRWNFPGIPIIYSSKSRAGAALERFIHINLYDPIPNIYMLEIKITGRPSIIQLDLNNLPTEWKSHKDATKIQEIGTEWAMQKRSLILEVPSAACPGEFNCLINPQHDLFKNVSIESAEKFEFDDRMFKI